MGENKIDKKSTYICLILCIIPLILCVSLDKSLVYGFFVATASTCIIAIRSGFKANDIKNIIVRGIFDCKSLYVVILLIGATVSVWISSGVVPSLIYYGLEYLNGVNFLFTSFLLVSITSIFMGTAVGTISTIGLAILGLGRGFDIPTHVLVGTIVSGAYLADKISPISGLLNLTLSTTKTSYKEVIKVSCYTIIPTILITALIYYILGTKYPIAEGTRESIELVSILNKEYFISPVLLLLPLAIIALSACGVNSIYCMSMGVLVGSFISLFFQDIEVLSLLKYIFLGFEANSSSLLVNEILVSGGVWSMVSVALIVIGAISLGSILQGTGIIKELTKNVIDNIKCSKELIIKTGFMSSFLTILTCDQTVGIVIPSKLLSEKYKELKLNNSILARTISDTGTIIAPILPWNINALIVSLVTGVSCIYYAPYSILCFIAPIMTFVSAYFKSMYCYKDENIINGAD